MKASNLRPGQFFDYTTAIDVRRCLCLKQDEIDTWIFDHKDSRTYRIASTTTVFGDAAQCWPGDDPIREFMWISANDAPKPPDMWTVIIYAVSEIQPEGYISTGCYNHETNQWHECIRVDPEKGIAGTMIYKDSVDDAHPNVLFWMDPRPPEGHTGNCND